MNMHLIPVIDLKDGEVVHAKQGEREHYQAIQSQLTQSTKAEDICSIFVNDFSFDSVYIADLNAITNTGNQLEIVKTLFDRFPDLSIWLDAGTPLADLLTELLNSYGARFFPVLGSETNFSSADLQNYSQKYPGFILSLDFNMQGIIGDLEILNDTTFWPEKIILMNLDRVGSDSGVDIKRIHMLLEKIETRHKLYIAGGIRNNKDLNTLEKLGVAGALVSSALHNKSIQLSQK